MKIDRSLDFRRIRDVFWRGAAALLICLPSLALAEVNPAVSNIMKAPAQLLSSTRPLVIGHRGFSKIAPENTLPSFRLALGARADLVELDYHLTRDKEMLVIHDYSVDRTTDAKTLWGGKDIAVKSRALSELTQLDAGSWRASAFAGTRLPTLAQALDTIQAGGITLIERKAGDAPSLLAFLRGRNEIERVVVQSFDWEFIKQCRSGDAKLVLGTLGPPSTFRGQKVADNQKALNADYIDEVKKLGANVVVWSSAVSKESVALAHQAGLPVWVYTIDDPAKAKELVAMGVNGIITNDPETIRKAIASSPAERPAKPSARAIPQPLPAHPGNIGLEGEKIVVPFWYSDPKRAHSLRLVDIDGKVVKNWADLMLPVQSGYANITIELGRGNAGKSGDSVLGVGWYRLETRDENQQVVDWTSAAVLAPLQAPTPWDSPICLDTALSWFARDSVSNQQIHANLAALAGVNWTRDRLTWSEIQPAADRFAEPGNYDAAAEVQRSQGLQVLQVFHTTPKWAADGEGNTARIAGDLRSIYRFTKELGSRFDDKVQAWEPWNEGNIKDFGGHTMDELCSWQKAAWLGFQAAQRKPIVGWNVLAALPTWQQTEGVLYNEVYPYFDTYNIHTYDWAHGYREYWEPARAAAGGKPLWITEADRGAKHNHDAPWYDLTPQLERLKAEYIGQSYASALAAGADRHFQFILGHYVEPSNVQFGLLRKDYTPRPAYVALAAAGRLLAGAHTIGGWHPATNIQAVAFRAWPDGVESDVIVLWTEREADWAERGQASAKLEWPGALKPKAVFDFLGRPLDTNVPGTITSAPLYVILPSGHAGVLPLEPPVRSAPARESKASSLVLQSLFPADARVSVADKPWSGAYAYSLKPGEKTAFTLCGYNFSPAAVAMEVAVETIPDGWSLSETNWKWTLDPLGRATATVEIKGSEKAASDGWVRLRARSATQPDAVLAFRVLAKKP
jgi:glycerophosphoryl diester phosphodiesterase